MVVHHSVSAEEGVEDVVGIEVVIEPSVALPLRVRIPLTLLSHGLRVFVPKLVVVRAQVRVGQTLEGFGDSWQAGRRGGRWKVGRRGEAVGEVSPLKASSAPGALFLSGWTFKESCVKS